MLCFQMTEHFKLKNWTSELHLSIWQTEEMEIAAVFLEYSVNKIQSRILYPSKQVHKER